MNNNFKALFIALLLAMARGYAQEVKNLSLEETVALALKNGDMAKKADNQVITAENQLNSIKNNQYPDVDISGQYRYLSSANVNFKVPLSSDEQGDSTATTTSDPKVNGLLLGQANLSLPLFSGFKLKNLIKAGENNYQAETFQAEYTKQQLEIRTITQYLNLYKAHQTIELIQENLKSAEQRVRDFSAMLDNGLLAKNDLLKAQLQQANIQISMEEAKKNENILNYTLATLLKFPEGTRINPAIAENLVPGDTLTKQQKRSDLDALELRQKAAVNQIDAAKSAYYPSLSLVGGYIALDVNNALTVTNAVNVGVGLSYNIADIFKTKTEVKLAKSRAKDLEYSVSELQDQVNIDIENAKQEYELSLHKLDVYSQSEQQAVENYRIVKDKYDNGLEDTNDLLEADVQQLQAKIDLTYARANIILNNYQLLAAQGNLTSQFKK